MAIDVGRVCIKTAGREAGRACVVIDTIDETYVMITGPKNLTRIKRRKCNIAHLEPLDFQLKLAKNAPDSEVEKLLQAEKILEKLTVGRPEMPKEIREEKAREEPAKALEKEKKGLRERILGRAKKGEKPEKPKGKPKAEKKPGKPKGKPKPKKGEKPKKRAKKPKPAKAPAKTKPAKKAKPGKKKK